MVTHNMQTRSTGGRHHQSVHKDYSNVVFKAVDLKRFSGGHKISSTKLHVVLVDHLTKEEEVGPYSKTSLRTFYASFRWGNFSMVRGNTLQEWNCSISPNNNQDKQIEVPSTIGVTLVPVTVLENLITQEDVKRFTEQTGPFLKNFNVQTLIIGTARSQVTSLLTHNRTQNYVHKNDLNHWWNSMNCETLCSLLKAYYGVQWKKSDGSLEQALMNLKFSLCYADRSLEKETADAYFNLIEIYERTYGPLTAHLESTIAGMIEERLQPESQLYKDFKKKKFESIRQGVAETVQLCFDRLKLCMENARTIIRQGQLYGSPDRVICHHHQSGDSSFWSEYPRPDIKIIEPLQPVTPDEADVPTAYVQSRNFLGRISDEHFTRENKEFIKEQEMQCMKQFTANVMNETKNIQREANKLAKKARQAEKRRVERLEEEERSRSNVPVEYICDTCGNRGHKRRDCQFNGCRDVNGSNLRWADSPIGQMWQYYGYDSFCCQSDLPENSYTEQLRDDQDDADRCRKKRKRGQSPMRADSNQSSENGCTVCIYVCYACYGCTPHPTLPHSTTHRLPSSYTDTHTPPHPTTPHHTTPPYHTYHDLSQ
jgi:hypothetical protein